MPKLEQPLLFKPAPLPTAELSADERLACLRLIRSENVGPVTFRELINRFGGAAQRACRLFLNFHGAADPAGRSASAQSPTPRENWRQQSASVRFPCSRSNPIIRRC